MGMKLNILLIRKDCTRDFLGFSSRKAYFAEFKNQKVSGVLSGISEGIKEGSKSHPGYQGLVNW